MPASKNRLAREYSVVVRSEPIKDSYPHGAPAFVSPIHDLRYYQGMLANDRNFSSQSRCEVFDVKEAGGGSWHQFKDDVSLEKYLNEQNREDTSRISSRFIFCALERAEDTSFRLQLSLSRERTLQMLRMFKVSPQFVPKLLGEPDHWSPGDFHVPETDEDGSHCHFFCQQPRWYIHAHETPWSIYMTHDSASACTTYIVSCSTDYALNERVKVRLTDHLVEIDEEDENPLIAQSQTHIDPFMLHCMITHESLDDGKPLFTSLRHRLYDELDKVDKYAKIPSDQRSPSNRYVLEEATVNLHDVSQDIDSTIASVDMAEMITERMIKAHSRHQPAPSGPKPIAIEYQKTHDSLIYLRSSIQAQRRWLSSYKSRKDIAMNLVFNLVTQQDAASSLTTALATQADGSAMTTIAVLTMLFLPATFVATLFGMAALKDASWQMYIAITLPLTALVVLVWYAWNCITARVPCLRRQNLRPKRVGGAGRQNLLLQSMETEMV